MNSYRMNRINEITTVMEKPPENTKLCFVYSVLVASRINVHFNYRLYPYTNSIRRGSPLDISRITFMKSISFITFTGKTAGA